MVNLYLKHTLTIIVWVRLVEFCSVGWGLLVWHGPVVLILIVDHWYYFPPLVVSCVPVFLVIPISALAIWFSFHLVCGGVVIPFLIGWDFHRSLASPEGSLFLCWRTWHSSRSSLHWSSWSFSPHGPWDPCRPRVSMTSFVPSLRSFPCGVHRSPPFFFFFKSRLPLVPHGHLRSFEVYIFPFATFSGIIGNFLHIYWLGLDLFPIPPPVILTPTSPLSPTCQTAPWRPAPCSPPSGCQGGRSRWWPLSGWRSLMSVLGFAVSLLMWWIPVVCLVRGPGSTHPMRKISPRSCKLRSCPPLPLVHQTKHLHLLQLLLIGPSPQVGDHAYGPPLDHLQSLPVLVCASCGGVWACLPKSHIVWYKLYTDVPGTGVSGFFFVFFCVSRVEQFPAAPNFVSISE